MASLNKVSLLGRVGKDPEVRNSQNGSVVSFSLATGGDKYKDKQGNPQVSETQWHNCVAFGNLAKIIDDYVFKGSQIYIDGKLKYEKYTSKDGVEKTATKIIVDNVILLGSKNENEPTNYTHNALPTNMPTNNILQVENTSSDEANDIPF